MADELLGNDSQQSTIFKMKLMTGQKHPSGEDKVGSNEVEVPDSGAITPVHRFEQGMAAAAGLTEQELQEWLTERLKTIVPIRSEFNIVLDITPDQVTNKTFQMNLMWAADRYEWVGISLIEWLDNFKWSNDFHFDGPYELDDKYKQIILKAYEISEDALGSDGISNTEPLKLVQIKRDLEKANKVGDAAE